MASDALDSPVPSRRCLGIRAKIVLPLAGVALAVSIAGATIVHLDQETQRELEDFFDDSKYQLMHIELFNHSIIHAECLGGDIDLLLNRRAVIGAFPWRLVDGESCICRILAFVDDEVHAQLMARKARAALTRFGDVAGIENPDLHDEARRRRR